MPLTFKEQPGGDGEIAFIFMYKVMTQSFMAGHALCTPPALAWNCLICHRNPGGGDEG